MDTKIQLVTAPRKGGSYRRHSTEFKREVVAWSLVERTSVSRLAREFNINANQVFTWHKHFAGRRRGKRYTSCADAGRCSRFI